MFTVTLCASLASLKVTVPLSSESSPVTVNGTAVSPAVPTSVLVTVSFNAVCSGILVERHRVITRAESVSGRISDREAGDDHTVGKRRQVHCASGIVRSCDHRTVADHHRNRMRAVAEGQRTAVVSIEAADRERHGRGLHQSGRRPADRRGRPLSMRCLGFQSNPDRGRPCCRCR